MHWFTLSIHRNAAGKFYIINKREFDSHFNNIVLFFSKLSFGFAIWMKFPHSEKLAIFMYKRKIQKKLNLCLLLILISLRYGCSPGGTLSNNWTILLKFDNS